MCVWLRVSCVPVGSLCAPVSDSADYVLCDGGSQESSVREAAVWRGRRAFDVLRTGQSSAAHDSASPPESSFCLFVYLFLQPDACGSGAREVVFAPANWNGNVVIAAD